MMRVFALVTALTFASAGRADELSEALKLVRQKIQFVDQTPGGQLERFGATLAFLGASFGVSMLLGPSMYSGNLYKVAPLDKVWLWVPGAAFGAGLGFIGLGKFVKANEPPRDLPSVAHFQTSEGLNEFMGLAPERQEMVARQSPEFADFILRLADAYRFVMKNRLDRPAYVD